MSARSFQRESAHRKDRRTDRSAEHVAGYAVRTGRLGEASKAGATRIIARAKDARKSRQTRRQNASTKIPQRER